MARSLLVGSVNLESADAVFEAVGRILGDDVSRVPDGETAERLGWIMSLEPRIAAVEALERSARTWGEAEIDYPFPQFRPRAGTVADKVRFANLGYAEDAVASYERFASAVERGAVPAWRSVPGQRAHGIHGGDGLHRSPVPRRPASQPTNGP